MNQDESQEKVAGSSAVGRESGEESVVLGENHPKDEAKAQWNETIEALKRIPEEIKAGVQDGKNAAERDELSQ